MSELRKISAEGLISIGVDKQAAGRFERRRGCALLGGNLEPQKSSVKYSEALDWSQRFDLSK
jgi:hypothetical protein